MGATVRQRAWRALASIEELDEGASIFSGDENDRAYFVNGRQVANTTPETIELRLTRKAISAHRSKLRDDPRVILRGSSDWIGVQPRRVVDIDLVVELAVLTVEANRPPPGATRKLPPSGPELERRRKSH